MWQWGEWRCYGRAKKIFKLIIISGIIMIINLYCNEVKYDYTILNKFNSR